MFLKFSCWISCLLGNWPARLWKFLLLILLILQILNKCITISILFKEKLLGILGIMELGQFEIYWLYEKLCITKDYTVLQRFWCMGYFTWFHSIRSHRCLNEKPFFPIRSGFPAILGFCGDFWGPWEKSSDF